MLVPGCLGLNSGSALTSCVTLGTLLISTLPQFAHLYNGESNFYLIELFRGLNELINIQDLEVCLVNNKHFVLFLLLLGFQNSFTSLPRPNHFLSRQGLFTVLL